MENHKMIEKVNLLSVADNLPELSKYLTIGKLNDHVLNIVRVENRTLDFHVHDESDEMFYIIEGSMELEFEEGKIELCEGDFIIIPRGLVHRPVCKNLVKVLLIEKIGTLTGENTGGAFEK
ncbi:MAG: cupin domain-containing protein [Methanobacteriaceae archaeon]|nr:cupin domain-containing protein [Methanobacteriaceae archaeon]